MLWQLKRLSDGKPLNEPGDLPEDWGPIFGLHGVIDKLGDLSWLGPSYSDMGWVEVEGELPPMPEEATPSELLWEEAKAELRNTDWLMLLDAPITVEKRTEWKEYRKKLRAIREQKGFPDNVVWPSEPK
ncbi:MAG: hypothetical protein CMI60_05345 [Parvibaculum sp.]|nr:hypothetical protein [Parvibaculum sp.]